MKVIPIKEKTPMLHERDLAELEYKRRCEREEALKLLADQTGCVYRRMFPVAPTLPDIARVAHEANRFLCMSIGDLTPPPWFEIDRLEREGKVDAVRLVIENPKIGPGDLHAAWMKSKIAQGWVYAPVTDRAARRHSQLLPFDQLDPIYHKKDALFLGVVRALT